jgi:hypothetical protein
MISQQFDPDQEAEIDEECHDIRRVSTKKAMEAVHILQTYKEQAEKGKMVYLETCNSYEKELNVRRFANMSQPSIACNDIPKKNIMARFHFTSLFNQAKLKPGNCFEDWD